MAAGVLIELYISIFLNPSLYAPSSAWPLTISLPHMARNPNKGKQPKPTNNPTITDALTKLSEGLPQEMVDKIIAEVDAMVAPEAEAPRTRTSTNWAGITAAENAIRQSNEERIGIAPVLPTPLPAAIPELEQRCHINGMVFKPLPGVKYKHDYCEISRRILAKEPGWTEKSVYRHLIKTDLFFIVYFVMRWPGANHEFIVNACNEIDEGPQTQTIDLWFREAGKSTVITIGRSIQEVLRDSRETICIFSYAKTPAQAFLRAIKQTFETSEILKVCFPDVVWDNPEKEAPKWSETDGLVLRRPSIQKEATFEAHGLLDGMPTGKHFSLLVYDDISTMDLVQTPDIMQKVKERMDMSLNVGRADGRHRVIGTYYHHDDALVYAANKKSLRTGELMYQVRLKPATVDGTMFGKSVFLPEARLDMLRVNQYHFRCQQLLDPTPAGEQMLDWSKVQILDDTVYEPEGLYKFMIVDPSGSTGIRADGRQPDDWACILAGVKPQIEKGGIDAYLIDGFIDTMTLDEAMRRITLMYCRHKRILKLGVEKIGSTTFEVHVANALKERGRNVSIEDGTLHILNPAGRKKQQRIEYNLLVPLNEGRIHILSTFPSCYRDRLKMEMDKFPFWKDDGLDTMSYLYDIIKDYRFGKKLLYDDNESDRWWREKRDYKRTHWMTA